MSTHWTSWLSTVLVGLPLVWQCGSALAQEGRHDHSHGGSSSSSERPSPNDPLEDRQRRFLRSEGALKYLDANQNGQIEAEEVQGSRKYLWDRMVQRLNVPSTFPQPVSKLREGLLAWYYLRSDQVPANPQPGGPPPGGPGGSSSSRPSGPIQLSGNAPGVTGFGTPSSSGSSPRYGSSSGTSSSGSSSSSRGSSSGFGSGSSSSATSGVDERIRGYAQSLLRQYDTNKNGVLERDEWKNMRGDMASADTNHDGIITLDELTAKMASYSRGPSPSGSPSPGSPSPSGPSPTASSPGAPPSSTGSSTGSSSSYGSRPSSGPGGSNTASSGTTLAMPYRSSYRFVPPKERLPRGLPEWFAAKDANGDGQISMSEFSSTWSEATAQEFQSYDLNGDGVVTPAECLKKAGPGR